VEAREAGPPPAADHLRLVQEVVWLWLQMQSRLQDHFAALAGEQALSAIQAKVLIQLDRKGAVTTRGLARQLQYDPSNLVSVIDRLEALGLVERRPDARDRRVKAIILTGEGHRARAAFWQRLMGDEGPLGALSAAELAELRSLLRRALAGAGHPQGDGADRDR